MATLTLTDANGPKWELYNVQLSDDPTEAEADSYSAPGVESGQTDLNVVSQRESIELTGLVTAPRLSRQTSPNSYSDDWRTALAEYAQRGEAFASPSQHTGYTLDDGDRDRSINVVIEEFTWTLDSGAPYQLSYEVTLRRGDGLLPDDSITVGSATPDSADSVPSLGGESLDGFRQLEVTTTIDLSVAERAFAADAGENDITATSGATRTVTYQGTYPGSASERNGFDDRVRAMVDDSTHTLDTVFPGYNIDVKLLGYDSTREWRQGADAHDYRLTMQESA